MSYTFFSKFFGNSFEILLTITAEIAWAFLQDFFFAISFMNFFQDFFNNFFENLSDIVSGKSFENPIVFFFRKPFGILFKISFGNVFVKTLT